MHSIIAINMHSKVVAIDASETESSLGHGLTHLHRSAQYGVKKLVSRLIKKGDDIEAKTSTGYTPLLIACYNGDLQITQYLVESHASLDVTDIYGNTPLHIAVMYDNYSVVIYLVTKRPDLINVTNEMEACPVYYAEKNNRRDIANFLYLRGADTKQLIRLATCMGDVHIVKYHLDPWKYRVHIYDDSILSLACSFGSVDVVKYLVDELKSDVTRFYGKEEETPMELAVQSGNVNLIKFLVDDKKIDVNIKNLTARYRNRSLLHVALNHTYSVEEGECFLNVLKYLVEEKNCDPNADDDDGCPPLHLAVKHNNLIAIKYLLSKGADTFNTDCEFGLMPLHWAVNRGHFDIMKYFAEEINMDIDARDIYGFTPLHHALLINNQIGTDAHVQYLVDHGANLSALSDQGQSPLHLAALGSTFTTIKYLVDKGSKVNLKNNSNQTPLDLAMPHQSEEVTSFLANKIWEAESCFARVWLTKTLRYIF